MRKHRSMIRSWTVTVVLSMSAMMGASLVGACVDEPGGIDVVEDSGESGDAGSALSETERPAAATASESAPASEASGTLDALLVAMGEFGEGSEERFEREWRAFSEQSGAVDALVDAYDRASPEQGSTRRKIAFAVSLIPSETSVSFLERVALEDAAPTAEEDVRARSSAAAGLARMVASGKAPKADAAMRQLLSNAAPSVARIAALELFAAGKLDDEHRRVLRDRDIPANFRKLTREETTALLRVHREEDDAPREVVTPTIPPPKHEG